MDQIKVELQSAFGTDRDVANAAWVSSYSLQQKELKTDEQVEKLIHFLAKNKHSVPFESIIFRFWMRIPIMTDRQIQTHRLQSSSGLSGRYRTMPDEFLSMPKDVALITKKVDTKDNDLILTYNDLMSATNTIYREYIEKGKAAEKAGNITNQEYKRYREFYRGILGLNNMTERISIMNLRSFANFYKLRSSPHAQQEIQIVAAKMLAEVTTKNICPIALKALDANEWVL